MQSYFDVNAHQPPLPEITRYVCALLRDGQLGNPSSTHANGRAMRYLIEQARNDMNQFFGGGWQVVFTSGATEANNLWFGQIPHEDGAKLMVSAVEHPSIMMPAKQWSQWSDAQTRATKSAEEDHHACALSIIKVSHAGEIDFEQLEDSCARADGKIYVSLCKRQIRKLALSKICKKLPIWFTNIRVFFIVMRCNYWANIFMIGSIALLTR